MSASVSPGRDADLALHQIDAGHEFRHRMLHLNARVDFDEVEIAVLVHQELDRARVGVADARGGPLRSLAANRGRAASGRSAGEGDSSSSF